MERVEGTWGTPIRVTRGDGKSRGTIIERIMVGRQEDGGLPVKGTRTC